MKIEKGEEVFLFMSKTLVLSNFSTLAHYYRFPLFLCSLDVASRGLFLAADDDLDGGFLQEVDGCLCPPQWYHGTVHCELAAVSSIFSFCRN